MSSVVQSQEAVPGNLRKRLAVAVRSIQWSYAIFWSPSSRQKGVLEWSDGYYNGDIKTRKMVQAMELKADKIGLQRSEQLRELYNSLLEGEIEQQVKRPSAALSPEDLTDAEWYYVVCMSFMFNPGQGLPGRAFENKQTIWLCNAQYADSKAFSRSLLAKSASIQTVVCFPYLEGVVELGVTEVVTEDPSLIQHFKASLLDFSKPVCPEKSSSAPQNGDDDKDSICAKVDHEMADILVLGNLYSPTEDIKFHQETGFDELHGNMHEEFKMDSPHDCSSGSEHIQQTEYSFMLDVLNDGTSQVQSWHFMDDEFSNGVKDSMNSSDCISEALVNQEKALSSSMGKNVSYFQLKELQEGNHTKMSSLDIGADNDMHYRRTLSFILKSSNQLLESSCFQTGNYKSSFVSWKRGGDVDGYRPMIHQNMLKKILTAVPLMHGDHSLRPNKENGGQDCFRILESDEGHVPLDKQRETEKFLLVPSIGKIDEASILNDVIKYLKELEATVEELESCVDSVDNAVRPRRNYLDTVEQTSDNYDNENGNGKKRCTNKRKACEIEETDPELNGYLHTNGLPSDVKVSIKEKEVQIEMRCSYREYILLDIMDEINNLHLDVHSVQSSTLDGILTLALKSKFRGEAAAPAGMIKQALWKIAG